MSQCRIYIFWMPAKKRFRAHNQREQYEEYTPHTATKSHIYTKQNIDFFLFLHLTFTHVNNENHLISMTIAIRLGSSSGTRAATLRHRLRHFFSFSVFGSAHLQWARQEAQLRMTRSFNVFPVTQRNDGSWGSNYEFIEIQHRQRYHCRRVEKKIAGEKVGKVVCLTSIHIHFNGDIYTYIRLWCAAHASPMTH